MRTRQLEASGAVKDGELLGHHLVLALFGHAPAPKGLRRRPAVADGDGALDLLRDERVVGDDDDGRAELAVDAAHAGRRSRRWSRCRARRSARRRGAQPARWPGPPRSRRAAARRRRAGPADGPPARSSPTMLEQLERALARLAGPVEDHRQLDVLHRRQVRKEVARRLLPDEADGSAPVARALASGPFVSGRVPPRWPAPRMGCRARRGC